MSYAQYSVDNANAEQVRYPRPVEALLHETQQIRLGDLARTMFRLRESTIAHLGYAPGEEVPFQPIPQHEAEAQPERLVPVSAARDQASKPVQSDNTRVSTGDDSEDRAEAARRAIESVHNDIASGTQEPYINPDEAQMIKVPLSTVGIAEHTVELRTQDAEGAVEQPSVPGANDEFALTA